VVHPNRTLHNLAVGDTPKNAVSTNYATSRYPGLEHSSVSNDQLIHPASLADPIYTLTSLHLCLSCFQKNDDRHATSKPAQSPSFSHPYRHSRPGPSLYIFWPSFPSVRQSLPPCHQRPLHHQQRSSRIHVRLSVSLPNATLTSLRSPVYEYPLNGQWIMMDIDDGYILWTGIWKGAFSLFFAGLELDVDAASFQRSGIPKVGIHVGCNRAPRHSRSLQLISSR